MSELMVQARNDDDEVMRVMGTGINLCAHI